LALISKAGALAYSTYLGGPDYDEIDALTLDSSGNLYLTGSSALTPAGVVAVTANDSIAYFTLTVR
jgi:hypothetical protein